MNLIPATLARRKKMKQKKAIAALYPPQMPQIIKARKMDAKVYIHFVHLLYIYIYSKDQGTTM